MDAQGALESTERLLAGLVRSAVTGPYARGRERSLITLKALTYAPTGGIVARPTSLPEHLGGVRNWDYRFCWLRDATLTLQALLARATPTRPQGLARLAAAGRGGRARPDADHVRHPGRAPPHRVELDWLPGYEGARPVRIGNAAWPAPARRLRRGDGRLSLTRAAAASGLTKPGRVQRALMRLPRAAWTEPDEGIWEMRGPAPHFTHSKVMAWVAVDRAVKASSSSA